MHKFKAFVCVQQYKYYIKYCIIQFMQIKRASNYVIVYTKKRPKSSTNITVMQFHINC